MIERRHLAQTFASTLIRAGRNSALSFLLVAGLAGCRHKKPPPPPRIVLAPVPLEVPPESENLPMITPQRVPEVAPVTPVELPPPRKATRRKPAPAKEPLPPPPVQVASAEPAATAAIGALSSGEESTPQSQQQAKDLIASITKRLAALPTKTADEQKDQVRQVSYFLKQAQQALDSGDAEGAKNLATKAKLLMDDVEKK